MCSTFFTTSIFLKHFFFFIEHLVRDSELATWVIHFEKYYAESTTLDKLYGVLGQKCVYNG